MFRKGVLTEFTHGADMDDVAVAQSKISQPVTSQPVAWYFRLFQRMAHMIFRVSRGMTLGVRAIVLTENDEVFLVRHTYVPGWHLPGGGVEPGETLEQALAKELAQEANIRLTGDASLHGVFLNRKASKRDHVAVFVVRDYVQDSPKQADREIAEGRFFPLDSLPESTTRGTRARLREVLDEEPLTPDW
jgi:ADP-ribose pyrophosphatase YjhB (NUDIX family)